METKNCLFEHNVIDAKLLAEGNGTLTMVNNGTAGDCIVILLNVFGNGWIYLDEFWTESVINPIEFHDETGLVFRFTKFNKLDKFILESNFYKIILPIRTSFTAVGRYNHLNK